MAEIRMNLYRDYADAIRHQIESEGYNIVSVQNDDEAALRLYASLNRRIIARRPRQILKASDFDSSNYEEGIAKLEYAIRNGENLSPYMSKTIDDPNFHDSMLDHWGIYHFHLGTALEGRGNFISRTGDILLCRVDGRYVYFIKVLPHGRNISAPWYRKGLIEIVHENWPESIKHALARGVTGISPIYDDQEVEELRRTTHLAILLQMSDGTVYMPPGVENTLGLVTGDDSNINDTRFSDKIRLLTKWVEETVVGHYLQVCVIAGRLGYHFKEPVSFVLAETQPDVYWDILETNSLFQFRIWLDDVCKADFDNMASSA